MCGFFQERGYPSDLLHEDLQKVSNISRLDTISSHRWANSQAGRAHWYLLTTLSKSQLSKSCFIISTSWTTILRLGRSSLKAPSLRCWSTPLIEVTPQILLVRILPTTIQDVVPVNGNRLFCLQVLSPTSWFAYTDLDLPTNLSCFAYAGYFAYICNTSDISDGSLPIAINSNWWPVISPPGSLDICHCASHT